ncbi:hypothetical protein LAUMK191_04073 [Mycobacterium attenuatum]|uniref:hypothetical protein n=1 Tax=Mycobacterium attenuatum TaxID=2341086 RepID=UPI000F0F6FB2|nr:hypothetical protein [Mycobacterium attenuatum]VBA57541.1 hypothetical protein LAUMK191_04073 [Mycobacterium attenuatum]
MSRSAHHLDLAHNTVGLCSDQSRPAGAVSSQRARRSAIVALGTLALTSGIAAAVDTATDSATNISIGRLAITLTSHDGFKLDTCTSSNSNFSNNENSSNSTPITDNQDSSNATSIANNENTYSYVPMYDPYEPSEYLNASELPGYLTFFYAPNGNYKDINYPPSIGPNVYGETNYDLLDTLLDEWKNANDGV